MVFLENIVNTANGVLWSKYCLIPLLLGAGLFFTIRTGVVQVGLLPQMFKALGNGVNGERKSTISSFEAFTVGLASRVGTGNLAGVAIAIVIGGPGAVFWMWVVAILGSSSAFIESTLAQLYKVKDPEVNFRGGPAYYMKQGLNAKWMGVAFAILISISFGLIFNALQANTIVNATTNILKFTNNTENFDVIVGIMLVSATGIILFGGTKRIADFTSKFVPIMALLYIILSVVIIVLRFDRIPYVFNMIISNALDFKAALGGGIGITIIQGVKRGLFSNEAGMGSAPNAAASATTSHPVYQGLIQSLGVYIDTIVICSATAFIILVSDIPIDPTATDGISVTMDAFSAVLGQWSLYFLYIAILLFAYSTILGNYFYAQSNIEYLSNNAMAITIFKIFLLILVFFGSVASSDLVWAIADLAMALMAILNVIAILFLHKHAIFLLKDFKEQLRRGGNPTFNSSKYSEYKDFEIWNRDVE
ncbi:MAG: alanine/glycine:cation symporter family protein [Lachnospirales bacterium]